MEAVPNIGSDKTGAFLVRSEVERQVLGTYQVKCEGICKCSVVADIGGRS